jgi:acyl-CoA synthetase (AMP-forming)/AMP-acid ligase II
MMTIDALPRGENPLDHSRVLRRDDGVACYASLPPSLVAMFGVWFERTPDEMAIAEIGGERVTFEQLWARCARVAGGLHARGIERGDRVAIRLPAGLAWVTAFFGTLMAGATVVPVNTRFTETEAQYVVDDSGSAYTFMPGTPLPDGAAHVVHDLEPDERAAIFYTSGTTGFPKGAITTHTGFLTNCENMARSIGLPLASGERVRTLISVPLFHVTGCNSQLLAAMYVGGASIVLPTLDLVTLLQAIPAEGINFLVTVPAVYALAINHPTFASTDISGVQRVAYGGAPIAPALVHRLKAAFPGARVLNGFGMTESASLLTVLPHEYAAEYADSVGFACPVVDLALEDVDPETGVGELLVRGPNITPGYWNKPEANALALVGGWLRTGDLARVDPNGLTYIVDRAKDMICRGGENVYCVEVENALAGAPGVAECAVIPVPDDVMGEKVGLVIVPATGATVDVPAVIGGLHGVIADFKIPQFVALRATPLPRNPGGKVMKKTLRHETQFGAPLR